MKKLVSLPSFPVTCFGSENIVSLAHLREEFWILAIVNRLHHDKHQLCRRQAIYVQFLLIFGALGSLSQPLDLQLLSGLEKGRQLLLCNVHLDEP